MATLTIEATAQTTPSEGCNVLNGVAFPVSNISGIDGGIARPWFAGETITATVGDPSSGSPTSISIELDGSVVASATYPGSVSYTFPADVTAREEILVDTGLATFDVVCSVPAPPPTPVASPVPTMSLYNLAFLALTLALLPSVVRRLR